MVNNRISDKNETGFLLKRIHTQLMVFQKRLILQAFLDFKQCVFVFYFLKSIKVQIEYFLPV